MKTENIENVKVVVGEYDVSQQDETQNRQVIAIREKHLHSGFDFNTFNNDICLLKLKKEVDMNIFPPVCLPSARLDEADVAVWIAGLGFLVRMWA